MPAQLDETLEAAIAVLVKHGIRRTSMADIAVAAGVSRQTLYSRFGNKEGVVQSVIEYTTDQTIAQIENKWLSCSSIADRLDVYYQHAVVDIYHMLKTMPDAADLYSPDHTMVAEAFVNSEQRFTQLLRVLLRPCSGALKQRGETSQSLAVFIVSTCHGLKHGSTSESDLRKKISTMRRMILLMVETE